MQLRFDRYRKIKATAQDWIAGTQSLCALASALGVTFESLHETLYSYGLADVNCRPYDDITYTDVLLAVLIAYTVATGAHPHH